MKAKTIRYSLLSLAILIFVFGTGWRLGQRHAHIIPSPATTSLEQSLSHSPLLEEVLNDLNRSYLEKEKLTNQKELIYGAINGIVASLNDPYTVFLPPKQNKEFQQDLAGSFSGVGIQMGYKDKQLAVIAPLEGTPAQKAGVKAGDIIIHIKDPQKKIDQDTFNLSLPEAVTLIRGKKGTPIELTLLRQEEKEPVKITIVRGEIKVASVNLKIIDHDGQKVAYLKLIRFGDQTNHEWDQAVEKILKTKERGNFAGVILDLRNNPGGYLNGAVYVASEFIDHGIIVQQENREKKKEPFSVSRQGKLTKTPLVVLINQGSASAAEIVAGALKEQRKTKLIGETTFGKGTVQESKRLSDGGGLHITIARWLLPSGKCIHQKGIKPDITVKNGSPDKAEDKQLQKALEEITKRG